MVPQIRNLKCNGVLPNPIATATMIKRAKQESISKTINIKPKYDFQVNELNLGRNALNLATLATLKAQTEKDCQKTQQISSSLEDD